MLDIEIEKTKNKLNRLIVKKFIEDLTYEDLKFVEQLQKCGDTKVSYTYVRAGVPQIKLRSDERKFNDVRFHLGRTDMLSKSRFYQNEILERMKKEITEKYLN
jgi:hypothetical protein